MSLKTNIADCFRGWNIMHAALVEIATGEGYYGAQAREYKEIAKAALAEVGSNHPAAEPPQSEGKK